MVVYTYNKERLWYMACSRRLARWPAIRRASEERLGQGTGARGSCWAQPAEKRIQKEVNSGQRRRVGHSHGAEQATWFWAVRQGH